MNTVATDMWTKSLARRCGLALVALTVSASSNGRAQTPSRGPANYRQTIAALRDSIPAIMSREKVVGASIALVEGGRVVWSQGFGHTDESQQQRVDPTTTFSIQSISKTYTTVAFMRLVANGQLSLEQRLRSVVPEFIVRSRLGPAEQDRITFRQLLSHRAGFPHEAPRGGNFDNCECTFDEHVHSVFGSWLKSGVGERYAYSNVGIDLAGYAMEKKLKKPFDALMQELLLQPLSMSHSTFTHDVAVKSTSFARGQIDGHDAPAYLLPIQAAGGMYSNVIDMAKFVSFELADGRVGGRQLVPSHLLGEMATIQAPTDHQVNGYGLGLELRRRYGTTVYTHGGGGFGYQTEQRWIPSRHIGVIVLTNYGGDNSVAVPIAELALAAMLQEREGKLPKTEPVVLTDTPVERVDSTVLKHLAGSYRGYSSTRTLRVVGDELQVVSGDRSTPLEAHGPAEFTTSFERYRFRLDNGGKPIAIDYLGPNGTDVFFPNGRSDELPGPNRPEWAAFAGTYVGHSNGQEFTSDIDIRNGYLYTTRAGGTRLREYEPGLFFMSEGESVLFNGDRMMLGNRPFVRQRKVAP